MADVAATLALWSATTNSNSPAGTVSVGTGVDDNIRELQGVVVRGLSHKGNDIATATTTDLGAVEGSYHDLTGTATVTGFGTVRAGITKILKYEGAATLTHNAASLILLGGANRVTADGDTQIVISEGSGNWREIAYFPVAVTPNITFSTGDVKLTIKTVADSGWVLMNDGTIGSLTSGGTTRANADTEALFTLLWNNTANADCAVSGGGRGASAAADFSANKTIALPKALGRALAGYGSGSGLTARAMGAIAGTETQAAAAGANPTAGDASGNAVQGATIALMQPTLFMNVMIKL